MSAIAISSPFSTARTTYTLPSLQGRGRTLRSLQISHHTKLHTRLSSTLTGTYITRSRFRNNNKNTITNLYAEENNGINYSVEKSADDFSSKEVESNSVLNSSEGKEVVVGNKEKSNAASESPVEGKSSGANDNLAGIFAVSWSKMVELFKLNGFWKWWPFWQREKRLQYLAAQADANPADSAMQSAFLSELNKHSPEDVIKRFEQKEYATDSQAVAEYLRALVVTNTLSEYLPDEHSGRPSFLPALLQELKERASGSADSFLNPGLSERHPLHVLMVDPKPPTKSARFAQELISTILFVAAFGIIWFIGTSALRKYTNSLGGVGSPPNISTSSSYSPKEYSKEFVPDKNNVTFKNVKGCDEAKQELQEVVEYLKNPAKFTRLGGKLPKGILLTGSPGTGKTLLAKAVAGEAGVPFFYRAGSEFEEMFVGVGARRVRSLFQAAKKKAPCIVFIDEIDAIGSTRKQWEGHTKKTLHQLLVEMDGFEENEGILLIAATNLPEILDPALTRPGRFDKHVVVPNPDVRGRQEILDLYLQNKPVSEDVDVKTIARSTAGFNGADLANLVNIAAIQAAMDGDEKLTAKQLEFAKDRIIMGSERKSMVLTEESRKLTAYHEGGHAIVAYYTNGANPLHKATIMPRGAALGMVTQLPDKDETSMSKKQMLASIDVCMGGRVAEELIFGDDCITTGAHSDFQKATEIAEYMVSKCGMSAMLGPFHVREKAGQTVQTKVDAEVMKLLRDAYDRVKTLLKKREEALHALAQALLEKETLDAKEIENILGSNIITIDEAFQSEQQADQVELAVS